MGFFAAAACSFAGGVIGSLDLLLSFGSPFDLINEAYLVIFGAIMLVIDWPVYNPAFQQKKLMVYKHLLFMTRFTGRGVWYMFLATMIVGSLWDASLSPFLGFFLGGYTLFLGGASLYYGIQKTIKLDKARQKVKEHASSLDYEVCPEMGLNAGQFNDLTISTSGVRFTDEEMHYVFNALSFTVRSDSVISQEEFAEWLRGTMPTVL